MRPNWNGKFPNILYNVFPDSLKVQDSFTEGLKRKSGKFQKAWNILRWTGIFPDCLSSDSLQVAWTIYRWPEKFPDGLTSFQMTWKVSRWPGKSPDGLEILQIAWKVSRWSGKFSKEDLCFQRLSRFATLRPCFFSASAVLISKAFTRETLSLPIPQKFCHEISPSQRLSSSSRRLPCDQHYRLPPVFVARPSLPGRVCSASSATSSLWWICWNLLLSWHGHSRAIFMGDNSAQATNENNNQCKPFNSSAPIYYSIAFCGNGDAFMKLAW